MDNNAVLQDDLRELLEVLGLGTHARPNTPQEVFQECLKEVRKLKKRSEYKPADILARIEEAQHVLSDASGLLSRYYVEPHQKGLVATMQAAAE